MKQIRANIEPCSFEEILPWWENHLWPDRESEIEPVSAIDIHGNIDMDWFENSTPHFWQARLNGKVVGVISAQTQKNKPVRMRGVWVAPDCRKSGVGQQLMNRVFETCTTGKHPYVWAMARHDSLDFYKKCGYREVEKITKYEFGPHFMVRRDFSRGTLAGILFRLSSLFQNKGGD